MKYSKCNVLFLGLVGSAVAAPGWSQQSPSSVEVRIEASALQEPDVRVEANVQDVVDAQVKSALARVADLEPLVRIVEQRQESDPDISKKLKAEKLALEQYTVAQAYQNVSSVYSPELAKKTRDIALLRQILALKLTARDIEKTLPLLREMKDADKSVPVKPEQAMDEEYNALLQAKPGDPMPPSSAEALRDAASGSRSRKQALWDKLSQAIGREKANGIRAMVRSENSRLWSNGIQFQNSISVPNVVIPQLRYRLETAPPPRAPREPRPASPPPDAPVPAKPAEGDTEPAPAAKPRVTPPADSADAAKEEAANARRKERDELRAAARARQARPAMPPDVFVTPGARALTLNGNGRTTRIVTFYGQASLDELIDLLERKLAAMRR